MWVCNKSIYYVGGSASFVFAVLLTAPYGEVYQFGGYQNYAATDRLWHRLFITQLH
jgi:hypothetical protein